MTPRERLLAVYSGRRPDCVPALADLSYWHAGHGGGKFIPGRTDGANRDRIDALLALHRHTGAAIHVNLGCFYREIHGEKVKVSSAIRGEYYHHRWETPVGRVEEIREWSPVSFSWPIVQPMVRGPVDLPVIRYVFENMTYVADWDAYRVADAKVGDIGLPLVSVPYTGMGFFMSRYAGVEQTVMLALDHAEEFEATLQAINTAHAQVCRLMAEGPSLVLIHSDNLSSDLQSPPWFARYSAHHFRLMAAIAHEHGKPIVTYIDGRLRGLLRLHHDPIHRKTRTPNRLDRHRPLERPDRRLTRRRPGRKEQETRGHGEARSARERTTVRTTVRRRGGSSHHEDVGSAHSFDVNPLHPSAESSSV